MKINKWIIVIYVYIEILYLFYEFWMNIYFEVYYNRIKKPDKFNTFNDIRNFLHNYNKITQGRNMYLEKPYMMFCINKQLEKHQNPQLL